MRKAKVDVLHTEARENVCQSERYKVFEIMTQYNFFYDDHHLDLLYPETAYLCTQQTKKKCTNAGRHLHTL